VDDLCNSYNGTPASRLGGQFIELAHPMHVAGVLDPADHVLAYALNLAAAIRALQETKVMMPEAIKTNTTGVTGEKWKHVSLLLGDLDHILAEALEKPN
jgi:hypothetical protein